MRLPLRPGSPSCPRRQSLPLLPAEAALQPPSLRARQAGRPSLRPWSAPSTPPRHLMPIPSCEGVTVGAGDTLCIVEAMKLMNEITAEGWRRARGMPVDNATARRVRNRHVLRRAPFSGVGRPESRMLDKILIANRGEIAPASCAPPTSSASSASSCIPEADRTRVPSRWPTKASASVRPRRRSRHLNTLNIIAAAQITGAQAIHPGYGFSPRTPTLPAPVPTTISSSSDRLPECIDSPATRQPPRPR